MRVLCFTLLFFPFFWFVVPYSSKQQSHSLRVCTFISSQHENNIRKKYRQIWDTTNCFLMSKNEKDEQNLILVEEFILWKYFFFYFHPSQNFMFHFNIISLSFFFVGFYSLGNWFHRSTFFVSWSSILFLCCPALLQTALDLVLSASCWPRWIGFIKLFFRDFNIW